MTNKIKWDRPCYKCLSHFCDLSCKETSNKQDEPDDEVLGFNGWGFPIEHPTKAKQEHGEPVALETVYETIIHWDEGGGKRSRRELARRIVALYTTPPAKQEQSTECVGEPVENRFVRELREYGKTNQGAYLFPSWDIHRALKYLHGYTTPQPVTESHKRKPLTDAQIDEVIKQHTGGFIGGMHFVHLARAIEAAHDIKE